MRVLKYLIFLLLIAAIGLAIYVAIQPDEYKIIKTRVIKAPISVIHSYVNDYREWKKWGVWQKTDPNMKIVYSDLKEGKGASAAWDSNIYGTGNITTTYSSKDSISQELIFLTPEAGKARRFWAFNPTTANQEGVIVISGIEGKLSFIDKFFILFQRGKEHKFNVDFEKGLQNLDSTIMADMEKYTISIIGPTEYGGGYHLYQTTSAKTREVDIVSDRMFSEIGAFMEQNQINASGNPFNAYVKWDNEENTAIISSCVPVKERIITPQGSTILCGYTKPGTYFKTILQGDYANTKKTWSKAKEAIKKQGLEIDPSRSAFEMYVKSPDEYPNPADLLTEIYIPISQAQQHKEMYQ